MGVGGCSPPFTSNAAPRRIVRFYLSAQNGNTTTWSLCLWPTDKTVRYVLAPRLKRRVANTPPPPSLIPSYKIAINLIKCSTPCQARENFGILNSKTLSASCCPSTTIHISDSTNNTTGGTRKWRLFAPRRWRKYATFIAPL